MRGNPSSVRFVPLLGVLLLLSSFGEARAQTTNTTFTVSVSRTPDTFVDTVLPTIRIDSYQTRLLGLLQGDPTLFYDQTFAAPFSDATVSAGIAAAMAALTSANSGNPLSFLGPTLDSTVESLQSSNTVTTQIGDPLITQTVGLGVTIGPATISIGNLGNCSGLQSAEFSFPWPEGFSTVSNYPFGCTGGDGQVFEVAIGTTNFNANTNSQYQFTREIQTTDTYSVFDTWRLIGVSQSPPVSVPEPGPLPLLALGVVLCLLTSRMRPARRLS